MKSKSQTQTVPQTSTKQCPATSESSLSLSKSIVAGSAQLAQVEMSLSISDVLSKPNIRSAYKGNDTLAFSVVNVLVNRFLGSFAFTTKLDNVQIESLTVDTLEYFSYESLEDIILFFKMARSGKLGTAKRAPDASLIFGEWFPSYMEHKAQERELQYEARKNETKAPPISMEDVEKSYAKSKEKKRAEQVDDYIDKITTDMDRQMLEDTIYTWERDPTMKRYVMKLKQKRTQIK